MFRIYMLLRCFHPLLIGEGGADESREESMSLGIPMAQNPASQSNVSFRSKVFEVGLDPQVSQLTLLYPIDP